MSQLERAQLFKSLHRKGDPLILFNIWDAGSALAVQETGAKALATGSWAVAVAHGYPDGEKLPLDLALENLRRITANINIPVTFDMEGGYGQTPAQVSENVKQAIDAGAVGINFEDQIVGGEGLYSMEEQAARISAIRQAADQRGIPFFINARTDIFLKASAADHSESHLEEAIQRAQSYAQAGGDGFFAPGLRNAQFIQTLVERSPLPLNILALADTPPLKQLADLGVARISHGAGPYRQAMNTLKEAARQALALG